MENYNFIVTDNAIKRLSILLEKKGNPSLMFRVSVLGGGCSGFQYKYEFVENSEALDHKFGNDKIKVLIDDISIGLINNSALDYEEDLGSAGFLIKNPNATAKCGCGNSFST